AGLLNRNINRGLANTISFNLLYQLMYSTAVKLLLLSLGAEDVSNSSFTFRIGCKSLSTKLLLLTDDFPALLLLILILFANVCGVTGIVLLAVLDLGLPVGVAKTFVLLDSFCSRACTLASKLI